MINISLMNKNKINIEKADYKRCCNCDGNVTPIIINLIKQRRNILLLKIFNHLINIIYNDYYQF